VLTNQTRSNYTINMKNINITAAKTHLSSILKDIIEHDEEVIINRAGTPIAKIIKYKKSLKIRRVGVFKNKIFIDKEFDKWPDDIEQSLGIKD